MNEGNNKIERWTCTVAKWRRFYHELIECKNIGLNLRWNSKIGASSLQRRVKFCRTIFSRRFIEPSIRDENCFLRFLDYFPSPKPDVQSSIKWREEIVHQVFRGSRFYILWRFIAFSARRISLLSHSLRNAKITKWTSVAFWKWKLQASKTNPK